MHTRSEHSIQLKRRAPVGGRAHILRKRCERLLDNKDSILNLVFTHLLEEPAVDSRAAQARAINRGIETKRTRGLLSRRASAESGKKRSTFRRLAPSFLTASSNPGGCRDIQSTPLRQHGGRIERDRGVGVRVWLHVRRLKLFFEIVQRHLKIVLLDDVPPVVQHLEDSLPNSEELGLYVAADCAAPPLVRPIVLGVAPSAELSRRRT